MMKPIFIYGILASLLLLSGCFMGGTEFANAVSAGYYSNTNNVINPPETPYGVHWDFIFSASLCFDARTYPQVLAYSNWIVVMGGVKDGWATTYHDIWVSSDGENWASTTPGYSSRSYFSALEFKGAIWVIGGYASTYTNDVWYNNGLVLGGWKCASSNAGFSARRSTHAVVFKDAIWVVGGLNNSMTYLNDVWYSADGTNWQAANSSAPFDGRTDSQLVVFKNRLWLIGGYAADHETNDIWVSEDGTNWSAVVPSYASGTPAIPPLSSHRVAVYSDKLYLSGGYLGVDGFGNGQYSSALYSSDDGTNWVLVTSDATGKRYGHGFITFKNKLWMIAGMKYRDYLGDAESDDVYFCTD